jgi:hypothetical protein
VVRTGAGVRSSGDRARSRAARAEDGGNFAVAVLIGMYQWPCKGLLRPDNLRRSDLRKGFFSLCIKGKKLSEGDQLSMVRKWDRWRLRW